MTFGQELAKPGWARLEMPDNPIADELAVPLPDIVLGKDGKLRGDLKEVSALAPTAIFENVGDFIAGYYNGCKLLKIAGRDQFLYEFRVEMPDYKGPVGVWGSSVLDNRMRDAEKGGLKPGSNVLIQFIGESETDKGNPAKLWRVIYK